MQERRVDKLMQSFGPGARLIAACAAASLAATPGSWADRADAVSPDPTGRAAVVDTFFAAPRPAPRVDLPGLASRIRAATARQGTADALAAPSFGSDSDVRDDSTGHVGDAEFRHAWTGTRLDSGPPISDNLPPGFSREFEAIALSSSSGAAIEGRFAYSRAYETWDTAAEPLVPDDAVDVEPAWYWRWPSDRPTRREIGRQLQRTLLVGMSRVRGCWDRALLSGADAVGQVTLALTFDRLGQVERVAKIRDDVDQAEFDKCLLSAARRLRTVSAPGERLFVEVPLQFVRERT